MTQGEKWDTREEIRGHKGKIGHSMGDGGHKEGSGTQDGTGDTRGGDRGHRGEKGDTIS